MWERSACFYVTVRGNFQRFQYFNFATIFFEKGKPFSKNYDLFFVESTNIESSKKNGVLPVATLFFWRFNFGLRTSYEQLILCTNHPDVLILTFRKNNYSYFTSVLFEGAFSLWVSLFHRTLWATLSHFRFYSLCKQASMNGLSFLSKYFVVYLPYWNDYIINYHR